MPMYDVTCAACGDDEMFAWSADRLEPCRTCGSPVERVFRGGARVIDDQLPGGPQWVHNMERHPIWIETKTQYQREMQKRGLRQLDTHAPPPGSDKHTTTRRWF